MDPVLLARIQFGFTAGFHFLFPPTTLGISLLILILESCYLKTRNDLYKNISSLLIRILGLVFVLGTATGITLEFSFGNNWAEYSRLVGDIFGAPLAAEAILSFFMESIFLGILVFGRERVSGKAFWWSSFFVFLGAHFSGLWILIANSWMQTPAGYVLQGSKAVLTNFWQAALNHSTVERFTHVVISGWITGSLLMAGIAAWYLIRLKWPTEAKKLLKISLLVFICAAFLQWVSGHAHSVQVGKTQPEKLAAFEAQWETQKGAPLTIFGLPSVRKEKNIFMLDIPNFLSIMVHGNKDKEIRGLKSFPKNERPPVLVCFFSYHLMVACGIWFTLIALSGLWLITRRQIYEKKWFFYLLLFSIPLPYLANELGWISAEMGRQPWTVYHVLKTADAASKVVCAGEIWFSLIMFVLIYAALFITFIKIFKRIVQKGPGPGSSTQY